MLCLLLFRNIVPPNSIPAVFANTGIEMGITVDFVRWVRENWYPNVETIRPVKPFSWVIENEGKPLRSKMKAKDLRRWHNGSRSDALLLLLLGKSGKGKYCKKHMIADRDVHFLHDDFDVNPSEKCCDWMKKKPFEKYAKESGMKGCLIGLRMEEGGARDSAVKTRLRYGGKLCTWVKKGVTHKAPIIDWSEAEIDEFISKYNVPLSKAYTEFGFKRTGCMACPFGREVAQDLRYLYNHEPNRYKAAMHWLKDVYIAQNVVLPFDEAYERERERMAVALRTDAAGNAEEIQTTFSSYQRRSAAVFLR